MKKTTRTERKNLSNKARIELEHARWFIELREIDDWMNKNPNIFPPEGTAKISQEEILTYPYPLSVTNTLKRLKLGFELLKMKCRILEILVGSTYTQDGT